MAQKKQNNAPAAQKLTGKEFLQKFGYLLAIALIITLIGAWLGYGLECAGGIKKVFKNPNAFVTEYLTLSNFGLAMLQMLTLKGGAFQGLKYGFVVGMMCFFGFAKTGKRFHRKGVEHGSAKWGSQYEKDIIADTNDFFNNVICSSDVVLVLDRKKRDINAMTPKEKAEYDRKKEEAKNAELERKKALAELYNDVRSKYEYGIESD